MGKVIWGRVVRILDFGAFIRPENADVDCLLHISSMSRQRVEDPRVRVLPAVADRVILRVEAVLCRATGAATLHP